MACRLVYTKAWIEDNPSPALAWLSVAGLLPSMARLRFIRQIVCTEDNEEVTEEDSRTIDETDST